MKFKSILNKEFIEEYVDYQMKRDKRFLISPTVICILIASYVGFVIVKSNSSTGANLVSILIAAAGIAFVIYSSMKKYKNAKNTLVNNMLTSLISIYKTDNISRDAELTEDKILLHSLGEIKEFELSDVKEFLETENFLVIVLKDNKIIPCPKDEELKKKLSCTTSSTK